jgi:O-antigen/teichoic acid export membrane protein
MQDDERARYSASALVHLVLLAAVMGAAVTVGGVGLPWLGVSGGLPHVLVYLGPASALMLMRQHMRCMCFARLQAGQALAVDASVAALQATGILALAATGTLTAARTFLVIGVATAPVAIAWVLVNRPSLSFRRDQVLADFRRNWGFSRWLLAGTVVIGATAALDPWAVSFMHGTVETATYAAASSIIALANPLVIAFDNFFGPHAAHLYAKEGLGHLSSNVNRVTLAILGLAGMFTLAVAVWGETAVVFLYGARYTGHGPIVTACMLSQVAELATTPTVFGLVAVGRGDILLKSHFIQLGLALTVGLWCIHEYGALGAGYGAVVSSLGAGVWKWLAFRRLNHED